MTHPLRAAAERIKQWLGETPPAEPYDMPIDAETLADAWLAEHPADDGEPVTEGARATKDDDGGHAHLHARIVTLAAELGLRDGANDADGRRLIAAAEKAGIPFTGCDTPDALAEEVLALRDQLEYRNRIAK